MNRSQRRRARRGAPGAPPGRAVRSLHAAVAAHRAGDLAAAERDYRAALDAAPDLSPAIANLGALLAGTGRRDLALALLEDAAARSALDADGHTNLGIVLQDLGRRDAAEAAYRTAIAQRPDDATACNNLGTLLEAAGRTEEALAAYSRAVELRPGFAGALVNRGAAELGMGRPQDALASAASALSLVPDMPRAHHLAGRAQLRLGRLDAAEASLRRALATSDTAIEIELDLAAVLEERGELAAALAALGEIAACAPGEPRVRIKQSEVAHRLGRLDAALAFAQDAAAVAPGTAACHERLGVVLRDLGRDGEALAAFDTALTLAPDSIEAHWGRAVSLLLAGRFAEGWPEYEWRRLLYRLSRDAFPPRPFPHPVWDGAGQPGGPLLVWGEQGVGDEIMFASMLADLEAATGGNIVLECEPRLVPLFRRSLPGLEIHPRGDPPAEAIAARRPAAQVAMGSLGRHFRRDERSFPGRVPYLAADPELTARLRARYRGLAGGRRLVGLSWRGGGRHPIAARRTDLAQWAPVLSVPGCFFVNLQYGETEDEIEAARAETGVAVFGDKEIDAIASLDDFAAQVAALDRIVSIANVTVHVAGALGLPTFALVPAAPDWRWLRRRDTSPWYPTLRLFRQPREGDWAAAIEAAGRALAETASSDLHDSAQAAES